MGVQCLEGQKNECSVSLLALGSGGKKTHIHMSSHAALFASAIVSNSAGPDSQSFLIGPGWTQRTHSHFPCKVPQGPSLLSTPQPGDGDYPETPGSSCASTRSQPALWGNSLTPLQGTHRSFLPSLNLSVGSPTFRGSSLFCPQGISGVQRTTAQAIHPRA